MKSYTHPTLKVLADKSWAIVGISLAATIVYYVISNLSGLSAPLVVALVIGALFAPTVDLLSKYLPRRLAAAVVLLGLVAISLGSIYIVVNSLTKQAPALRTELTQGFNQLNNYLSSVGIDIGSSDEILSKVEGLAKSSPSPARFGSVVGSGFSIVSGLVAGTIIALFMLYYILSDWQKLNSWISSSFSVPKDLAEGVLEDGISSLRQYFSALTFTSVIVSFTIGLVALFMGIPSAFAIAVVTLVTSYVPYIGAFFAGAFAVLLALGSQGLNASLILVVVIIVVQVLVQPVLQNVKASSELDVHPAIMFASTIIGSTVAGVLGAVLSGPVVAMILRINKRLKNYKNKK
ncbi:AI-2E family transporter [Candidatus Saccharibacteria bacterium]|nr:AI-2E family transporter [Candidatus Saccharibacteria bacterium]MBP9132108.1 AI-2E family transporter [Candidatus Saccharibacteria bacterium]